MSTKSVLVVEDKELNRKVVRIVLEAEGYEILEATTAEETVQVLHAETPDLILMDIALPGGMDGEELTQQLKTDPRWCHVPILALTAAAMKGDRERILRADATIILVNLLTPAFLSISWVSMQEKVRNERARDTPDSRC